MTSFAPQASAVWAWEDRPGVWQPYDPLTTSQLEQAFAKASDSFVDVALGPRQAVYRVELDDMRQMNARTGYVRGVLRTSGHAPRGCPWEYDDGAGMGSQAWLPFTPEDTERLEDLWQAGRLRTVLRACGAYAIDLGNMQQRSLTTGKVRQIRRNGSSAPPPHAAVAARRRPLPPALIAAQAKRARRSPGRGGGRVVDEVEFKSHEGFLDIATITDWRLLRPVEEYDPEEDCPITCCPLGASAEDPVVRLSCGCQFNRSTVERALVNKPQCPTCHFHYAMPGAMPSGRMVVRHEPFACEGNEGTGTYVIDYSFPDGDQGPQHPNPGAKYHGTERTCYVPDGPEGTRLVALLKKAFQRGITFKVGTSVTTGRSNVVTWAIHHKTSPSGGSQNYGWPDEGYYERCAAECAALGLLPEESAPAAATIGSPDRDQGAPASN